MLTQTDVHDVNCPQYVSGTRAMKCWTHLVEEELGCRRRQDDEWRSLGQKSLAQRGFAPLSENFLWTLSCLHKFPKSVWFQQYTGGPPGNTARPYLLKVGREEVRERGWNGRREKGWEGSAWWPMSVEQAEEGPEQHWWPLQRQQERRRWTPVWDRASRDGRCPPPRKTEKAQSHPVQSSSFSSADGWEKSPWVGN